MPIENPVITQILQAGPRLHLERLDIEGWEIRLILSFKPFPIDAVPARWRSRGEKDALLYVRFSTTSLTLDAPADRLKASIVKVEGETFRFLDVSSGIELGRATALRLMNQDGALVEQDCISWHLEPLVPGRPPRSKTIQHFSSAKTLPLTSVITPGRRLNLDQIAFEGTSCHLCLYADPMPEDMPAAWRAEGYDRLQVRLSLRGIGRIQLQEIGHWANAHLTDRHLHLFDKETGNRQLKLAYSGVRASLFPFQQSAEPDPRWW